MQDSAGAIEDADRQLWFSEAAAFLQSADHWWCQHPSLTGHFAEIFLYHTQPVVKRLWDNVAQQLSSCALCVVNYHAAQVCDWSKNHTCCSLSIMLTACTCTQAQFQQSYADSSADELLGVLHQLDVDRLHAALHDAMAVQSGEHIQHNSLKQSHDRSCLLSLVPGRKIEVCPPSAV